MEVKDGYKKTEIGVIPNDWELRKLEDVSYLIMGQSPIGSSYNKIGDGYALINGPTEFTKRSPVKIQWTSSPTKFCKNGDILICVRGSSTGRINISNDEYCIGRGVAAIRAKERTNHSYLEFQINDAVKNILSLTAGSTFPNIDGKTLKQISIPLPPLPEQKAIAEVLSDADNLIQAREKRIAKKRLIKQGAMQKLLTPKEDWEVKKLGKILKVRHGKSQKDVEDRNGQYPILGTGGLMGYGNQFLYDRKSVLIGRKGTIDKPRYMDIPFWTVDTLFYTEIFKCISPKYLFYKFLQIDWYSYNEASGVPSLNAKTIENIEISLPPLEEQTRIATILSDMDTEIETLEKKLAKYKQLKQGLMQNLLTGKIRLV